MTDAGFSTWDPLRPGPYHPALAPGRHAMPAAAAPPAPMNARPASTTPGSAPALGAILLVLASGCSGTPERTASAPAPAPAAAVTFSVPDDSLIPKDAVGASIRRGRAIVLATPDSLPGHVGNGLRCVSCHLDNGARISSGSWIGVYPSFPQYNKRGGRGVRIQDRANESRRRRPRGGAPAAHQPHQPQPVRNHDVL